MLIPTKKIFLLNFFKKKKKKKISGTYNGSEWGKFQNISLK